MSSKVEKIIRKTGKAFTKMTRKLTLPNTKFYLLQVNGLTNDFILLQDLTNTWSEFDDFRGKLRIKIGMNDSTTVENIRKADTIAIGQDPYYIYDLDMRDKVSPDAKRPFWELFGTQTGDLYSPKLAITVTPASLAALVGDTVQINWVSNQARAATDYLGLYLVSTPGTIISQQTVIAGSSGSHNFVFNVAPGSYRIGYYNNSNVRLAFSATIVIT